MMRKDDYEIAAMVVFFFIAALLVSYLQAGR